MSRDCCGKEHIDRGGSHMWLSKAQQTCDASLKHAVEAMQADWPRDEESKQTRKASR